MNRSFFEIRITPKQEEKNKSKEISHEILHPTKFDPSIPFSVIIFNLIDEIDYKSGKYFIKKYNNCYITLSLYIFNYMVVN